MENGVELTIRGVRRDESGRKQRISAIGARCFSADGKALPMFHTHSDGNYQLSPTDIVTVFTRNAPFEGVQRGERYLVWEFASRLSRLVISIDTERANRRAAQP